jgi:hypothetical protein
LARFLPVPIQSPLRVASAKSWKSQAHATQPDTTWPDRKRNRWRSDVDCTRYRSR